MRVIYVMGVEVYRGSSARDYSELYCMLKKSSWALQISGSYTEEDIF